MFTPQIVTIGPFHNPKFNQAPSSRDSDYADMERCKTLAVQKMSEDVDFSKLVAFLKENKATVRRYYEGLLEEHAPTTFSNDLATSIATHAVFVTAVLQSFFEDNYIYLAEKFSPQDRRDLERIENELIESRFMSVFHNKLSRPVQKAIFQDLLLVENQIPLFAVEKVIALDKRLSTSSDSDAAGKLLELYLAALAHRVLPFNRSRKHVLAKAKNLSKTAKHLLDGMYSIVSANDQQKQRGKADLLDPYPEAVPGAQKLILCGVTLHGHGGGLTDISFKNGKLYIPKIHVSDDTERIFRNLIAYESSYEVDKVDVLSYLHFMDFLIDTPEDVEILAERKIITENAGSNQKVADMWNRLCRNTVCVYSPNYKTVTAMANKYCDSRINTIWAEFYRLFLSRPWLPASVVSAALLLGMTFVIMYYTILIHMKEA